MNRSVAVLVATAALLPVASIGSAQTKTVTGETRTVTAVVEAIEASTRTVTLKKPDGTYVSTVVPESVKRFDSLKIGDKVTAKYYENVVLRLKQPGEKDVDTAAQATTPAGGGGPAGTAAKQRTITATITAIDQSVPSITFTGPNNWKYSSRVEDKAALAKVKVGDKVDITWTEAMLLSLDIPAKP
jgi:hypothetical protein